MENVHGDTDNETDDEDDRGSGRDVPLRLDKIIMLWSCQMLNIDDNDNMAPDRPRVVSNAHLGTQEMEDDVKNYIASFPLKREQQFKQD